MEIIFVRHAEKDEMSENGNLSKKGLIQAKNLAKRLSEIKLDEFYCSDKIRAKETASIVSESVGLNPIIENSLNEFDLDVFKIDKNLWNNDLNKKFNELKYFLEKFTLRSNDDKKILIIAHGNTNRLILSILLELELRNLIRFRQLETAINEVYWMPKFGNWRLKYWNDVSHQPQELVEGNVKY